MAPSITASFSRLLGARLGGALIQVLQLGLFARVAGPELFGTGVAALGICVVAMAVFDFGLGPYVTKTRAQAPTDPSVRAALQLNTWSAGGLAAFLVVLFLAGSAWLGETALLLVPLAIWAASEKITEVWLTVAVADGDTQENLYSVMARRVGALALQVCGGALGLNPMLAFTLSQALACLVCAWWIQKRIVPRLGPSARSPHGPILRSAWPFYVNTVFAQLRNLDVTVVGLAASASVAGLYGVPARLTSPLRMVTTTMAQVALPQAARARSGEGRALIRGQAVILLAVTVAMTGVAALSGPLVSLLGDEYDGTDHLLQVLCVGLVFAGAASLMSSLLQARQCAPLVARVSLITTIACLVALAVVAPRFGAMGATVCLASSFVLQAALLARRTIDIIKELW